MSPVNVYKVTYANGNQCFRVTKMHTQSLRNSLRNKGVATVVKLTPEQRAKLPPAIWALYKDAVDLAY
jgi:hypothetical protein